MSNENKENSFAAMFEESTVPQRRRRAIRVGDRLEGVVVQVGRDSVFVELDGKQQAFIEANELRNDDGTIAVAVGDKVSANVVEVDDERGVVRLARSMGKPGSVGALEQAREAQLPVEGKVTGVNKGGLEVEVGGTRGFCPMRQADSRYLEDARTLIGQSLQFLVTDVKDGGRNVVLSRRAYLEREANERAVGAMTQVVVGAVLRGRVTSVRDFGAFVDLGGVEGLIPRSEIGHDRSVAVAEALQPGETVEVQVREIKEPDPSATTGAGAVRRITLSLKALQADPWAEADLVEGRVVQGTVTRVTEFGAFVRLAPAIEGLLHVSEISRSTPAGEGQELLVVVKKIDRAARKISLIPAPEGATAGSTVTSTTIAIGAIVEGAVERIETYGVFVQLDGTRGRAGRGLVPNAELGVARGTDLRKVFPEGTRVRAKVLETGEGRLRLSVKGALDAEERAQFEAARGKQGSASLGTFADLFNKKR